MYLNPPRALLPTLLPDKVTPHPFTLRPPLSCPRSSARSKYRTTSDWGWDTHTSVCLSQPQCTHSETTRRNFFFSFFPYDFTVTFYAVIELGLHQSTAHAMIIYPMIYHTCVLLHTPLKQCAMIIAFGPCCILHTFHEATRA